MQKAARNCKTYNEIVNVTDGFLTPIVIVLLFHFIPQLYCVKHFVSPFCPAERIKIHLADVGKAY